MFQNISNDVNKMIELSYQIGCLDTEWKYVADLNSEFYDENKSEFIKNNQ